MPRTANYTVLKKYLPNSDSDNYALISHYIQLQGTGKEKIYEKVIHERNINLTKMPQKTEFNLYTKIPYANKDEKFTFIDLFAGIGGFRMALQNCGGECVFSSEWDEAAKQTYFANYGEVPFGDITKINVEDIPEYGVPLTSFGSLCSGFRCRFIRYANGYAAPTSANA